jgi:GTP-binding protein
MERSIGLMHKPRWLVFTKADLLPEQEAREKASAAVDELGWQQPWFLISSATGEGTRELMQKVSDALLELGEQLGSDELDDPDES